MDCSEQRPRPDLHDYRDAPRHDEPPFRTRAPDPDPERPDREHPPGYTLMVAGRRTGKTSFLRLLLDTTVIAPSATQDQLASVAKFVQGCSGYTSTVRTVSVDVDVAVPGPNNQAGSQTLALTLIDTPALDFTDEIGSQQVVAEILRHVDARFADSVQDVRPPYFPLADPVVNVSSRSARPSAATTMSICE